MKSLFAALLLTACCGCKSGGITCYSVTDGVAACKDTRGGKEAYTLTSTSNKPFPISAIAYESFKATGRPVQEIKFECDSSCLY